MVEYDNGGDDDIYEEYRSQYEEHNFRYEVGPGDNSSRGKAIQSGRLPEIIGNLSVYRSPASRGLLEV